MKMRISEQTVLFISIVKWLFLSTVIGIIVGLSTTGFLKLLNWSTETAHKFPYTFLFLPAAFFLSALIVKYLAPDAEGHGTEKVIEAVHKNSGRIKAAVVPVKLAATIITLATGGSAGKEGPSAQIGAGLASLFADIFKFDDSDRKKLVICGISAGFAAVFGTPIAGAIFGIEVLFIGSILYDVLLPSFMAGIISYEISSALGVTYFHNQLNFIPDFSGMFFLKVLLAGIFFGLCSFLLIETMILGKNISNKLNNIWPPLKGIIGGGILVIFTLLLSGRYLGLGLDTIESCLQGNPVNWYDFLMKSVFTSITLNFGGSGGIITPVFFVGSTAGAFYAGLFKLSISTFAALGFVSLLAGTANTPIAASIMAVELFGPKIAPYAAMSCVISFLLTGHRSVYPSQVLSIKKSSLLEVELGKEIENTEAVYDRGKNKFRKALSMFWEIERTIEKKEKDQR
ncbi:MAG: chloride channel protein [Brevinematales bacterium]|jgi:H+/Cl- antiporter ClcA